jgi:hypothetical protein
LGLSAARKEDGFVIYGYFDGFGGREVEARGDDVREAKDGRPA